MSCLITFHLFKFNDGRVFDMKKEEEKQIDLVMRFMDVLCDNYPEVEQIISLLGNETENEDILKDMYKNLNTVDCEEVYAELKDSSNISEEDGDELDYSEDDQLSSDSEDDLEDRELLRELKKKKDVGDDEDVKEKHVQRRLDQAILDNKGYVPGGKKKKKTPGVKRRQQFQKASLRNRSNVPGVRKEIPKHEGEARGIKTNVIKSRKF
uniref:Sas10 domain-containing protein n=1 Tax=Strongyloides venezuelensis TaxID=75913 RepID=A0A0K0G1T1_STRVS